MLQYVHLNQIHDPIPKLCITLITYCFLDISQFHFDSYMSVISKKKIDQLRSSCDIFSNEWNSYLPHSPVNSLVIHRRLLTRSETVGGKFWYVIFLSQTFGSSNPCNLIQHCYISCSSRTPCKENSLRFYRENWHHFQLLLKASKMSAGKNYVFLTFVLISEGTTLYCLLKMICLFILQLKYLFSMLLVMAIILKACVNIKSVMNAESLSWK